jgi:hypothetical protein
MSVEHVEILIERLMAVFGEPKTDDPATFLGEYRRTLKFYGAEVLEQAADRVIDEAMFWPRPSEVRRTASAIAAELAHKRRAAEHKPIEENPTATPEEKAAVAKLVSGALNTMKAAIEPDPAKTPLQWLSPAEFAEMQRNSRSRLHRRYE